MVQGVKLQMLRLAAPCFPLLRWGNVCVGSFCLRILEVFVVTLDRQDCSSGSVLATHAPAIPVLAHAVEHPNGESHIDVLLRINKQLSVQSVSGLRGRLAT